MGRADRPRKVTIHEFIGEHEEVMKGQVAYATLRDHPYVFVSPKRLERIKERRKIGKWNPRSALVNNLTRDFNVIRRRANVADCNIHDLRRSAITNWAQRLPIQVVQTLAGHSNIATTRKYYLAVRSEDFTAAGELLNSILAKIEDD